MNKELNKYLLTHNDNDMKTKCTLFDSKEKRRVLSFGSCTSSGSNSRKEVPKISFVAQW